MPLEVQDQKLVEATDVESVHQLSGTGTTVLAFNKSQRWTVYVNGYPVGGRQTHKLSVLAGQDIKVQYEADGSGDVKLTRGLESTEGRRSF